jgi:hypothetical protein
LELALPEEVKLARVVCVCVPISKPNFDTYIDLIPSLRRSFSVAQFMLVGVDKDEHTFDPSLLGGSISSLTPKMGNEWAKELKFKHYVEVSTYNFKGFRTLANAGLSLIYKGDAKISRLLFWLYFF